MIHEQESRSDCAVARGARHVGRVDTREKPPAAAGEARPDHPDGGRWRAQAGHRPRPEDLQTDRAGLAPTVPGAAIVGTGEGCAAAWAHPEDLAPQDRGGGQRDASRTPPKRHALEHSQPGQCPRAERSMRDGKVIGDCRPRHRHQEFIRFLKKIDAETPPELDLHLIVDNYGTHKHPQVKSWLRRHPRFHLHFIPTSSSWLNLVERWFREITDKRLRRGSFENVPALIQAITEYLDNHNQNPKVFVWSAPVERIMAKIAKCKEALDALH